ncbi:MAG: hypothetical protein K2V38_18865 [Gemmataceae bacterium]|nr:hypothetical protein [Gemmataceae bacterium]
MSQRAVECECGAIVPAPEGMPGPLVCSCHMRLIVPHEDEFASGKVPLSAPSLERRVRRLVEAGELPQSTDCAGCGAPDAGEVECAVACEQLEGRFIQGSGFLIIPGLYYAV